jgi:hypothetical protein
MYCSVVYIELTGTKKNIWLLNRVALEIKYSQASNFTNCGHRKLKSADQFQVGLKYAYRNKRNWLREIPLLKGTVNIDDYNSILYVFIKLDIICSD